MSTINAIVPSLNQKKATAIPTTAQTKRGGAYSVNLVYAKGNRKSLTLSKKLAEHLTLFTDVYITVYGNDGSIALSPTPIDDNSVQYIFSNDRDFIVYNAALVQFIAETFALDYTSRTSMSFRDIKFGTVNDTPIAEVILKEVPPSLLSEVSEVEAVVSDEG
jgi:hypothetical protein